MSPSTILPNAFVAPTAVVSPSAVIARGVRVWDDSHVEAGASVGSETLLGRGVTVGAGVQVGARCKIQNGALVYGPAVIGDGVFVGPGVVLTNDNTPRAINPDGTLQDADDWRPTAVVVEHGASLGAGALCVAPVRIGRWALVAAGAVVVHDVPDHALVAGVPARRIGWVSRTGRRLAQVDDRTLVCTETGDRFRLSETTDTIEAIR
ncbi:N-acetyltransferase [Curtobacterium sp. VKM Ac-2861]|uniref:acyltransferase n=1 Tax=unclassified Curtobacterium TaxID=257496 RepID=UPI000F47370B|nr:MULTISPECIES: acyltransferase [unclassified Curtobacterium]NQW91490.1 N-acetyltransferase [Curtobacterium sp. VKM Ac-2861]ROS36157.1 transferase family hexapeptide repeat protein [Curtobacterium sp. PhB78]